MKSVVSSWSMTHAQASALLEATSRVRNRSKWINDAIEKKILKMDEFSISDVPDRQLILHFHHRFCSICKEPHLEFMTCPNYLTLERMAE